MIPEDTSKHFIFTITTVIVFPQMTIVFLKQSRGHFLNILY